MRWTLKAVIETAADRSNADRQPVENGAVADELISPQCREGRDRVHEWPKAGFRQTGRHPDHVLLGHPDVKKPFREALGEWLEHHEAEVAGEQNDRRIALGEA